jgi:hypothetical protein
MDLSTKLSVWTASMATVQFLSGVYGVIGRNRAKRTASAWVLIVCALGMFGFVFWLHRDDPLRPQVSTIPCPPTKSGPATTYGEKSPANSGSGNPTTYGKEQ